MISLDIVDAQVHLNRIGPAWRVAELTTTLELGIAAMDAAGVDALLIDERWGTDLLVDDRHFDVLPSGAQRYRYPFSELAYARHPGRFAFLGRVHRHDPELPDVMAELRNKPGCVGLRIEPMARNGELEPFKEGRYAEYFAAAQKCSLPVFVRLSGQTELLIPYLQRFPDLQIIMDHCGTENPPPSSWDDRVTQFESVVGMARFPNLAMKWSKAPTRISMEAYPFADLNPLLRKAIDAFGPQRLMWASDATESKGRHSWADAYFYLLHSQAIDATERQWLLGRSVRNILRWPVS